MSRGERLRGGGGGGGGGGVMHYVGQEGKLDLATVRTKSPQLESCSAAKLAANPVNLVAAPAGDLLDHQPCVICELFHPTGAAGAWRCPAWLQEASRG